MLFSHTKPDGDALGSTLAIARALALRPNPPSVHAVYVGPYQPGLREVADRSPLVSPYFLEPGPNVTQQLEGLLPHDADAIVITDTCSWSQLDPFAPFLRPRRAIVSAIDHHVQGNAEIASLLHVDTSVAAICQSAAEVCRLLLGVGGPGMLPAVVAEPLYLGLATDTGWFRHSNVGPTVLRLAADLLDAGADHTWLFRTTEQREHPTRLRLVAAALASVELRQQGTLAMMSLSLEDMRKAGAQPGETGGLTDFTQALGDVRVSALFTETPPEHRSDSSRSPAIKVSLRSKEGVDVSSVASAMGGGGHVRAAGVKLAMPMQQAKDTIERALAPQLAQFLPGAGQVNGR